MKRKEKDRIALLKRINDAIFLLFKKLTYNDISDKNFKMDRYVELVVNNNVEVLRKIKMPYPKAVLIDVYNDIQKQYMELSKNGKESAKIKQIERRKRYIKQYNLLMACGSVLSISPTNKDVIEWLNENGIKGDDLLKKIKQECNVLKSRIDEIDSIFEKEKKQEKKSEPLSFSYYYRTFAMLNKNGYKANWDMPVLAFIETINIYAKEIEENNKQIEQLKTKKK